MKSGHALNFPHQRTLALLLGLQTLHFTPLQAQEAQTEVIDTIVVTGSRSIERSILESPVPVDSFSAQDVITAGALFFSNRAHDLLSPITDSGRYFYTGMNVRF